MTVSPLKRAADKLTGTSGRAQDVRFTRAPGGGSSHCDKEGHTVWRVSMTLLKGIPQSRLASKMQATGLP